MYEKNIYFIIKDRRDLKPGRRRKQLLDYFKEMRVSWNFQEKAVHWTVCKILFWRSYRPVARENRKLMD